MTNSSDFLYSPKWTLHHPLTFVFKHLVSYIPFYQIKLKAQSLKIVEPESGLHVCVTVFFFNKGITFFFIIKPGIVGLLCILNANKVHAYLLCMGVTIGMITVLII